MPLLENKGLKFIRITHRELINILVEERTVIFIVRYLTDAVLKWIENNRVKIEKIYYFMDDDLFDLKGLKELLLRYAWKIFNKTLRFKNWIIKNTQILVSNEYLKEKYQQYNPLVLPPYPAYLDLDKLSLNPIFTKPVCFYHATASHKKEFFWLKDLLESLQQEDLLFELVVDKKIANLYNRFRNVWVVNTMKWHEYLQFSALKYRHIGLALLFDSPFNRGRSYVKFFNIIRSGAVGIYSEHFPLAKRIKEFQAGVVLPMEVEVWKSAVLELAGSSERREKLFKGAKKLLLHLKEKTLEAYQKIPV
jgi:hypothetical protein